MLRGFFGAFVRSVLEDRVERRAPLIVRGSVRARRAAARQRRPPIHSRTGVLEVVDMGVTLCGDVASRSVHRILSHVLREISPPSQARRYE
jgi:hypothetical protein